MTRKEMQKLENKLVEKAWEKAKPIWFSDSTEPDSVNRLNYCQAWVYELEGYVFLVSHYTPVTFIDSKGDLYDVLRLVHDYRQASSIHISKFKKMFRHVCEYKWIGVSQ